MRYCDHCGQIAGTRKSLRDPRRNDEPTDFFFCSDQCEEEVIDKLERQARLARLVN